MRLQLRIIFTVLVLFLGYKAIQQETGGIELGFLGMFHYITFFFVILVTIVLLLLDSSAYFEDRNIRHYGFSLVGLVFCCVVSYKIWYRNSVDSAKTIMTVVNKSGALDIWEFKFKTGNHFSLTEFSSLGQTNYYGQYQIQGNRLTILKYNYDGPAKNFPVSGEIRKDTVFWDKSDTMIILLQPNE
jgi:hypothetical protein